MYQTSLYPPSIVFQNETLKQIPGFPGYYASEYNSGIFSAKIRSVELNDLQISIIKSLKKQVPVMYLSKVFNISPQSIYNIWDREPKLIKLKESLTTHGYPYVLLKKNKVTFNRTVHSLVLLTYEGPRPNGLIGRHLNDDKLNNNYSNLAYGTHSDNAADMVKNGNSQKGKPKHKKYFTDDLVFKLRFSKNYRGYLSDFSKKHNIPYQLVWQAYTGLTYKHLPMPERQKAAA